MSDVKFSHSGRYMLTRDYLTVKVWDLNMEARPIETYQVNAARRPLCGGARAARRPSTHPPPSHLRSTITFGASSVPSMRTTAFSTSSNVPGTGATGNLQTAGRWGGLPADLGSALPSGASAGDPGRCFPQRSLLISPSKSNV